MAALTGPRSRTERLGSSDHATPPLLKLPVAAATRIWAGALVSINASGLAVPASTATTQKIAGRAEATVDNLSGLAGDKVIVVSRGAFKFENSASGDAIVQADVGNVVYAVDDQTVAKTSGTNTRSPAGIVLQIDPDGVFVEVGLHLPLAALLATS
jgi:hydroxyacyl-ACP dehydratase HTD2-like protein with hotdog domain